MKKKIRDLTKEELEKICRKNGPRIENCKNCPLYQQNICTTIALIAVAGTNFLDREVDIPQPHILDKKEHDCLRAVVELYKIKSITLIGDLSTGCLNVRLENNMNEWFELPVFKKGSMYKGMEVYKEYSIQDLELDKEWNNEKEN